MGISKDVINAEAERKLRITEELSLPEYVLAALLETTRNNARLGDKLQFVEARLEVSFEDEKRLRTERDTWERNYRALDLTAGKTQARLQNMTARMNKWKKKAKAN